MIKKSIDPPTELLPVPRFLYYAIEPTLCNASTLILQLFFFPLGKTTKG